MIQIYHAFCILDGSPRFSWKLRGDSGQIGYRIKVQNKIGDFLYDSKMQFSMERHNIECGFQIQDGEHYSWTITCYASDGSEDTATGNSFYSPISQWQAKWIEPDRIRKPLIDNIMPHQSLENQLDPLQRLDPAVYMRQTFLLESIPEQSITYITAHGIYALWINGIEVSDLYAPGYTSYHKRVEYQCYDVTSYLQNGANVIGVVLADGWYTGKIGAVGVGQQFGSESALLLQLECKYSDGSKKIICSDKDFVWTTGAWNYADLFVGEYYDAEKELKDWLKPSYRPDSWKPVVEKEYGYDVLALQSIPPVRILRSIRPKVLYTPKGELILDAGENIVGFVSFGLELKKGDVVRLEHTHGCGITEGL